MKKIAFILLAGMFVTTSYAQSSKVVTAYRNLEEYKRENDMEYLNKAKEAIDLASEHIDTREQAKTQVYKGQIYFTLYEAKKSVEEKKLTTITDLNIRAFTAFENTPSGDLETSYQAFLKAKQLDVKGIYTSELKAIKVIGNNFDNLGRANYNAKKYDLALSGFERSYEIAEYKDTVALEFAALSAKYGKNNEKAKTYFQQMLDKKVGGGATYFNLMNTCLILKDSATAMDVLKKGRVAFPSDIDLLITETNYFLKNNKSTDALNNLTLAIQARPADANLYLVRGNIYDNLANPKDAANKELEKPKDYDEKIKLSEADYKKAIELKTDYFDALFNLGVLYYNQGVAINKKANQITDNAKYAVEETKANAQYAKAMEILEKAHNVDIKDRNVMVALKQIYTRLQLTDKLAAISEQLKK